MFSECGVHKRCVMDPNLESIWALDPDKERQKMANKKNDEKFKIWVFSLEKMLEASPEAWKSFREV